MPAVNMADDWKQRVMDAVDREDGAQLQHLLQNSEQQTLNYIIERLSPLTKAACLNSKSCNIIEQLLLAGADVDFPNVFGETPLMITAQYGNIRRCELLLKYGANVNARNHQWNDTSVLSISVSQCKTEIIALLLEHGAQIYDPPNELPNSYAPVYECQSVCKAIEFKFPCVLKMFLDHSNKMNVRLPLAGLFSYCLSYRSEECAIMILELGYYPHPQNVISLFHWAATSGVPSNLMSLMVEINPHCLQSEWLISQKFPSQLVQNTDVISLLVECRKQPPSLTQLCKSAVLAHLNTYYLRQGTIDELPLPKLLKVFLKKM